MSRQVDETHDPTLMSWVECANGHLDFPIQNLPLGVFRTDQTDARIGVAIGERILDLRAVADAGLVAETHALVYRSDALNAFFALSCEMRREARKRLSQLLSDPEWRRDLQPFLHESAGCELLLPARIGDYTDFYAGIHHALNVGRLFRPNEPLLPNYKYIPIAYHGRASSVRSSDVPVRRPNGQRKGPGAAAPSFGPSERLDYEVEMGVWLGPGNELGEPISIAQAADHIAGFCLLNDWSARDLQAWEYQPLGPFLAKSFHSTVSPWVITPEALAPFRVAQPARPDGDPAPLPHLFDEQDQASGSFAITIDAFVSSERMRATGIPPHRVSNTGVENMYWTIAQMIAHHASNGCNLKPADLLGTGTISGDQLTSFGSLLELTKGGSDPIKLPSGETRTFLLDGDEVELRGRACAKGFVQIGLGSCRARVVPA